MSTKAASKTTSTKAAPSGIKLENFFPGYIGQSSAVGELNEVLTLEKKGANEPFRPLHFKGPAGLGKTRFAKMIAAARDEMHGGEHRFVVVPPGTTRPQLISILAKEVAGRPATIFCDESHDMEKRLRNMLKPILETDGQCEDVPLSEECIFPANPFQHLWITASNEDCAAKDPALWGPSGRFTSLDFVAYSDSEKAALLKLALKGGEDVEEIKADADAVEFLCKRVWANARAITQEMGPELRKKALLAGGKINLAFAKAFAAGERHHVSEDKRHTVARYPMGLTWKDIQILRFLDAEVKGKQVSEIANHIQEPMKSAQYRLHWLSGELQLIQTLANGRKGLDKQGGSYLATMEAARVRMEAAKKGAATKGAKAPKAEKVEAATPASV